MSNLAAFAVDVDALCSDLLEEAKTASGTWLLETHNRLVGALPLMSPDAFECFFTRVIKAMTAPSASGRERFKLAQICAMCRGKGAPHVTDILQRFKGDVLAAREPLGDPLDEPIAKILDSLYAQIKTTRSPPVLVVRCRVQRPVLARRLNISRTPEP
jgi:hypothetical protein